MTSAPLTRTTTAMSARPLRAAALLAASLTLFATTACVRGRNDGGKDGAGEAGNGAGPAPEPGPPPGQNTDTSMIAPAASTSPAPGTAAAAAPATKKP